MSSHITMIKKVTYYLFWFTCLFVFLIKLHKQSEHTVQLKDHGTINRQPQSLRLHTIEITRDKAGNINMSTSPLRGLSKTKPTAERIGYRYRHIALLKTHKTGSSTVQNLLLRYGLAHNLTFYMPQADNWYQLGWPWPFDPKRHIEMLSYHIDNGKLGWKPVKRDILCLHSVFSTDMVSFLAHDTFYLTILRDPFTQFRSAYNYYSIKQCSGLSQLELLDKVNRSSKVDYLFCSMPLYNSMMYDLGADMSLCEDDDYVNTYIQRLDRLLNMVMITEYFDESLVVLKDMLGLTDMETVIFAGNVAKKESVISNVTDHMNADILPDTPEYRELVYDTFSADTALYQHFKSKLEKFIEQNKSYMESEKLKIRKLRDHWMQYCVAGSVLAAQISDQRFRTYGAESYGYVLTAEGLRNKTCIDLAMVELPFIDRVRQLQNN